MIASGTLWQAWQRVRTNHGGAGGDGVGQAAFERNAPARIESLREALIDGHYRPGPLRHVALPKNGGETRPLDIPCIADRIVQTATAQLLVPVIDPLFSPGSFAYRPHKGVAAAVHRIVALRREGYRWTAEGDVRHCFEEIPHAPLLDRLEGLIGDARICDLVGLWLECFSPDGVGIPQGSPISPLLCNVHLDAVDQAMAGHGVRLIRFADDFVLLTRSEHEAAAALENMAGLLRSQGLELNPDKTRIRAFDQSLKFLGHIFVRGMAWKEVTGPDTEFDSPVMPDAPPEEWLSQWPGLTAAKGRAIDGAHAEAEDAPARRTLLHVMEKGSTLSARHHAFAVGTAPADGSPAELRVEIHADRLERIEIGPGAHADWHAMQLAAAHGVPLAMVDGWGQTLGWLAGPADARGDRMLTQARWLADPARVDALAQALVLGRVRNQRAMLRRLNRQRRDAVLAEAAVRLGRIVRQLEASSFPLTIARGHEGQAAAIYWPALAQAIPAEFGYRGLRERRPPPDPVNAVLGYLYALLERDMRAAVARVGLHGGMGALHVARRSSDVLVYDLMEAFRAPVAETILTTLINRRVLRPDMFVILDMIAEDGTRQTRCRMEQPAKAALIQGYEAWLGRPIRQRDGKGTAPWRALFEAEVRALLALFEGRTDRFIPYELDW